MFLDMCHQTGAYQVVGLACYRMECHWVFLPIQKYINSIFPLCFVCQLHRTVYSWEAQASPSCISDLSYISLCAVLALYVQTELMF